MPRSHQIAVLASLLVLAPAAAPAVAGTGSVSASAFTACADYDGLSALGSPLQTVAGVAKAGTVRVRHVTGTPAAQTIDESKLGLPVTSGKFGYSTTTAQLNTGDGCMDVVVGVPDANGGAGKVVLIPGSGNGLALDKAVVLDGAAAGIVAGDHLGSAVTTVKTDAGTIVVAGAPYHDVASIKDAGALVTWLIPAGGVAGELPTAAAPQLLVQGIGLVPGHSDSKDHFGAVLAQPSQRGTAVLTIGVPDEDVSSKTDSGVVAQLTYSGASLVGSSIVWPGSGMPGSKHSGDRFGAAVVAPRGVIEAIGIPGLDVSSRSDAGGVVVRIPAGAAYQTITQNTAGVPDSAEAGDALGTALGYAFGVRGVEVETVVVGVPGENTGAGTDSGAVLLIDNGSESTALAFAAQKVSGLSSKARFGQVIAVVGGDTAYDEDMHDVVLVGAPGSKSSGAGKYYKATSAGISVWESGMYFATQA